MDDERLHAMSVMLRRLERELSLWRKIFICIATLSVVLFTAAASRTKTTRRRYCAARFCSG